MTIYGKIVDHRTREIFEGSVEVKDGVIVAINRCATDSEQYIMVGFIDAHVHIESSMLTPQNFGRLAVSRGTVAIVTDPHEVANVLGVGGIDFMLENAKGSPMKCFFTIPSCVPATPFDVSGAEITADDVERMAASGRFVALSEMMNVPGVLSQDDVVMPKLAAAQRHGLPVDGHAPLLMGEGLKSYIAAGITTEHEASTLAEGIERVEKGMKVLIRQGSAARNYDALHSLIDSHRDEVMFCTDDSHPDEIIEHGQIDKIMRMGLRDGYSIFDLLHVASANPIAHYGLEVGQLRVGDKADFVVVENLESLRVKQTYVDGVLCYDSAVEAEQGCPAYSVNNFTHDPIVVTDLHYELGEEPSLMIGVIPNELITRLEFYEGGLHGGVFESDVEQDVLKIVYVNRYTNAAPQVALCRGIGLKRGAIATSIAHDSHNIIAIGCSDAELVLAINTIIEHTGGLAVCDGEQCEVLPLPIAGIMSDKPGKEVASKYAELTAMARALGTELHAPFMTLSFLSLIVIPEVKIGEKGLFDYTRFDWIARR